MKADIRFSNDRQVNDYNLQVKARTNLGFVKVEYDKELKIKVFWGIPIKLKKKEQKEEEQPKEKPEERKPEEKTKPKKSTLTVLADNTDGVKAVLGHLVAILTKCRLRLRDTDLAFSAGSPDTNGYLSAVLAMIPAIYAEDVRIRPDFTDEQVYVDGHVHLYIRIYTFRIIVQVIKLLLDKDVRKLITEFKG